MRKQDLKAGMVVKLIKHNKEELAFIVETKYTGLSISSPNTWMGLDYYNDDLEYEDGDYLWIEEVYDLCKSNRYAWELSIKDRKLLWKREKKAREYTVSQLEKLLGHPIKIVKES